jgi:3-methyladenine DNA glycosylase AlkC
MSKQCSATFAEVRERMFKSIADSIKRAFPKRPNSRAHGQIDSVRALATECRQARCPQDGTRVPASRRAAPVVHSYKPHPAPST